MRGVTSIERSSPVGLKAAEHQTANKTITGRQEAAEREAASAGKVRRDPLRDGLGVVIATRRVQNSVEWSFQADFGPRFWFFSSFFGVLKMSYRLRVTSI